MTAEGERVAAWSRAVLAYCDAMRKEVALMQNDLTGHLRVGAMPSMSPVLPFLIETVRKKYPGPYYWAGFVLTGDSGGSGTSRRTPF